jgi:N utilization substance protein A
MSDQDRGVITAIVDEDQLSLAIGRNGQNVRLASQLIGWQIDLYGSREWLALGADLSLFKRESDDDAFETSDFALAELDLTAETLAALESGGYSTFLQIIDFDRAAFLAIAGFGEEEADQLLALIDELTVVADEQAVEAAGAEIEDAAAPEDAEAAAPEGEEAAAQEDTDEGEDEALAEMVDEAEVEEMAAAGGGEDEDESETQAEADAQVGEDGEVEEVPTPEDENEAHG